MITYQYGKCPRCGRNNVELMYSNNPLVAEPICFECLKNELNYKNLEQADFFCRTYNLPFKPETWLQCVNEFGPDVFKQYTSLMLEQYTEKVNLYYTSSTHDVWAKANKEWERCRSLGEILNRLQPIKESYIDRGRLKWGEQYTFEELIKLDSIYTRTIRSNNITNPLQKEAVKTICKLQIEMDEAIRAKDAKAIKDFSSAYSTFAKQADLEGMINETRTDDITTVAELYQYMEDQGYIFKFHDGYPRDEVDRAIDDIQETNRKLILESTGLQGLLEEMINQRIESNEKQYANEVLEQNPIQDLLNFSPEDGDIDQESDEEAMNLDFAEVDPDTPITDEKLATTTIVNKDQ